MQSTSTGAPANGPLLGFDGKPRSVDAEAVPATNGSAPASSIGSRRPASSHQPRLVAALPERPTTSSGATASTNNSGLTGPSTTMLSTAHQVSIVPAGSGQMPGQFLVPRTSSASGKRSSSGGANLVGRAIEQPAAQAGTAASPSNSAAPAEPSAPDNSSSVPDSPKVRVRPTLRRDPEHGGTSTNDDQGNASRPGSSSSQHQHRATSSSNHAPSEQGATKTPSNASPLYLGGKPQQSLFTQAGGASSSVASTTAANSSQDASSNSSSSSSQVVRPPQQFAFSSGPAQFPKSWPNFRGTPAPTSASAAAPGPVRAPSSKDHAEPQFDTASTTTATDIDNLPEEERKVSILPVYQTPTLPKLRTIEPVLKKRAKQSRISVCTFKCRSSLRAVRYAIRKLGWEEITTETVDCAVAWLEHNDSTVQLSPFQCTSKIEGLVPICRKAACAISLNRISKAFPNAYSFVPKTWVLRRDGYDEAVHLEKVMNERKGWVYIAKPTAGSQGRGVQLIKKWPDLKPLLREVWPDGIDAKDPQRYRRRAEFVVQRYVTRPLLVNGLKFDCRVYVLLTSIIPLRAYLFEEGLARFCTVPYERPRQRNLQNSCMHLTNYAVNKKSANFEPSRLHDDGTKRSLSSVFELIALEDGPEPSTMWQQIKELAERTLLAIKPSLIEHYGYFLAGKIGHHPHGPKGFQIIGLDIIFEDNCRPKLLELNANCSLSCLSPMQDPDSGGVMWKPDQTGPKMEVSALDLAIKSELVAQTMLLVNPLSHRKSVQGRMEFQEQCGGLPAGSVFTEPLPNEEQRREANPPRRGDQPKRAPAFKPLDFTTNHQAIFDFVQSHEHTYRLFRGLLSPGQTLFTKNSFRSLVISGYFLYARGLEDSDSEENSDSEDGYRIKIFEDMPSADAFFARVLFEANRENPSVNNGLNYLQFLKYICVELGSRIDDTSEFHAIHAFVRRCVGTYEGTNSSDSDNAPASEDEGQGGAGAATSAKAAR